MLASHILPMSEHAHGMSERNTGAQGPLPTSRSPGRQPHGAHVHCMAACAGNTSPSSTTLCGVLLYPGPWATLRSGNTERQMTQPGPPGACRGEGLTKRWAAIRSGMAPPPEPASTAS